MDAIDQEQARLQNIMVSIGAVVSALLFPWVLLLVVLYLGHSIVWEECAKALLVFFVISKSTTNKWSYLSSALVGLTFGVSETMLYAGQLIQSGQWSVIVERFLITVPMHTATAVVLALVCKKDRRLLPLGLLLALGIHWLFNRVVG